MARAMCLAIAVLSLAAAPGCSSCFGGASSCRRPSFMEFRSCGSAASPCAAPAPVCAPACEPACAPACEGGCGGAAACCDGGEGMSMPAPVVGQPGTFS